MISRLFKKKPQVSAPRTPTVPEGTVAWAVGDVHGRLDLLVPLVEHIIADAVAEPAERTVVIFLGDYIDRGPDSRGVIRYLAGLPKDAGIEWRFLKGNHEEAMLNFLDDPSTGPTWCEYGGDAALASYGLRLPQMKHKAEAWAHLSADLDHKTTAAERTFLKELELSVSVGDYFFCHAGARPGVPLAQQAQEDLLWIRRSFLDHAAPFEKIVVHGHTPSAEVVEDHRRIGLDTKAYETGRLTAMRFVGKDRGLAQTAARGAAISVGT